MLLRRPNLRRSRRMIVGVDIGSQSLKVAVMDSALRIRGRSARSYPISRVSAAGLGRAGSRALGSARSGPAIAEALASAGADASSRSARSAFAASSTAASPSMRTAIALSPCLTWMDRRATAEIADIPPELIRRIGGLVLDASHLAAKARWLKRHLAADRPIARFHQPVSFMVERLTGHCRDRSCPGLHQHGL